MAQDHKQLARALILAAQLRFGNDIRLFERHAGLLFTREGKPISPFRKGQADLYGWLKIDGMARHVEIELKIGRDKLRAEQEDWKRTCEEGGVTYLLVHVPTTGSIEESVKAACDAIARVRSL